MDTGTVIGVISVVGTLNVAALVMLTTRIIELEKKIEVKLDVMVGKDVCEQKHIPIVREMVEMWRVLNYHAHNGGGRVIRTGKN